MLFKIYLYLISLQKDVTKNALSTLKSILLLHIKATPGLDKQTNKQKTTHICKLKCNY